MSARELEQVVARAEREGLVDAGVLEAMLKRHPRRRGTGSLRALLANSGRLAFTRSEAEERLLALVRRSQLPPPQVNARLDGYEVDFLWFEARLVVEVDGYAFHSSFGSFHADRRRDAVLTAAGFRVMRITWRQLTRERDATLVRLAQALARGSPPQAH